jgi:hypothetical protein
MGASDDQRATTRYPGRLGRALDVEGVGAVVLGEPDGVAAVVIAEQIGAHGRSQGERSRTADLDG